MESILLNIFIKNISQIQNVKLKGCSELSSFIHDIMVKSNWIPMPNYYPDITLPGIRLWLVTIILYCCNNQSWIYECKTSQQCPVFSPLQEVVRSTSRHVWLTSPEIGTRVISCHYKLHDTSSGDVNNFTLSPITTSITFDVFRLAQIKSILNFSVQVSSVCMCPLLKKDRHNYGPRPPKSEEVLDLWLRCIL